MKQRIASLFTLVVMAMLLCAPAALADEEESVHNLAIFLGICVVVASAVVMELTNRHFRKKRQDNARKNRERAKSRKKKKKR